MHADGQFNPFRAQLLLPEQRQFYDYWLKLADGELMPQRSKVSPRDIARLLPGISLVDVLGDKLRFRVRLAGTRLREVYEREITGCCVEDLEGCGGGTYWQKTYSRIVETGAPAQGVLRGPQSSKDHLVLYWVRLPLAVGGREPGMIFGFDQWLALAGERLGAAARGGAPA